MTVAQLISELQRLPPTAPVWVQTIIEFEDWEENRHRRDTEQVEVTDVRWEGNHVEIA